MSPEIQITEIQKKNITEKQEEKKQITERKCSGIQKCKLQEYQNTNYRHHPCKKENQKLKKKLTRVSSLHIFF